LKSKIEKNFEKKSQYFRLCHNDFQLRNILLKTTEQGQEPFLIDLEYVSYNYIAYDIANLLSEACYDASYRKVRSLTKEDIQKVCELYPGKYEGIEEDVTFLLAVPNYFYSIWALTGPPLKHVCLLDLGLEKLQMYKYYMERA
jgi:ethanolamine kinase